MKLKSDKDTNYHDKSFKRTFRFVDYLLSVINKYFKRYISLKIVIDLLFSDYGELKCLFIIREMTLSDKVNYPFMNSNIPINIAYDAYVS